MPLVALRTRSPMMRGWKPVQVADPHDRTLLRTRSPMMRGWKPVANPAPTNPATAQNALPDDEGMETQPSAHARWRRHRLRTRSPMMRGWKHHVTLTGDVGPLLRTRSPMMRGWKHPRQEFGLLGREAQNALPDDEGMETWGDRGGGRRRGGSERAPR